MARYNKRYFKGFKNSRYQYIRQGLILCSKAAIKQRKQGQKALYKGFRWPIKNQASLKNLMARYNKRYI